jgi:hypothetical protein
MFDFLRSAKRALLDRDSVVAVPPMDGPFKPNNGLEQAERLFILPEVDAVAVAGDTAYCSAGRSLYRIENRGDTWTPIEVRQFPSRIAFVTGDSDGRLIVGVDSDGLYVTAQGCDWKAVAMPAHLSSSMTAALLLDNCRVLVCIGSTRNRSEDWKRDLMENTAAGLLVVVHLDGGSVQQLAANLAFPYGTLADSAETVLISESWRHRLIRCRLSEPSAPQPFLEELPGYPARIAPALGGGFWLSLFAPRRQLFELLLGEDDFRSEMIATIDADEWIGPDFAPSDAPDQPLQQGSVRQMGILKPWAPSRSYGLVVRCDKGGAPVRSWHSRADGSLHGVVSIVEWNGRLLLASRGAGVVARLSSDETDHD